ncbi:MAG: kinase [Nocardiopsaceae bacterium]|nr:kinase [Nocardiopsaceae bacterium]
MASALFAGLCTFDLIQRVSRIPGANEKVTALEQAVSAGGPAANASVAFAFLGGRATLVTGIGSHPLAQGMRADLEAAAVSVVDAAGKDEDPPAVSSIVVTAGSGDRRVVSLNAAGRTLAPPPELDALAGQAGAVLIDGHHPRLAMAAARAARRRGRLCVLDGGSWKANTADLLPYVDIAVCSADFRPPGVTGVAEVLDYLLGQGVAWAAVTDGANPVTWAGGAWTSGDARSEVPAEVPVPKTDVADTLGAGDIFHGALIHGLAGAEALGKDSFRSALEFAASVAAHSCRTFGTRAWMKSWATREPA